MNDDLGNFPKPPSLTPTPNNSTPPTPKVDPTSDSTKTASLPSQNTYSPPTFEPTPDELPDLSNLPKSDPFSEPKSEPTPIPTPTEPELPETKTEITPAVDTPADSFFPEIEESSKPQVEEQIVEPDLPIKNEPQLATVPTTAPKSPTSALLSLFLLLVAGIGISGTVFLYSQSSALKKQLTDINQTLDQQKSIITPSPSPTIIDIPTPTPTSEVTTTPSISLTPTATPSVSLSNQSPIPLALAPQALKVALNHEPNAQLILIKIENANDTASYLTKYYFRKDLTTKKYFYVSINNKNESEVNDNAIYVNPDNNIPPLNDLVLGNKLGIDYAGAYAIAIKQCSSATDCEKLTANAQYIKSGDKTIWQITLDPTNKKYVFQINSQNKEVLFKSSGI